MWLSILFNSQNISADSNRVGTHVSVINQKKFRRQGVKPTGKSYRWVKGSWTGEGWGGWKCIRHAQVLHAHVIVCWLVVQSCVACTSSRPELQTVCTVGCWLSPLLICSDGIRSDYTIYYIIYYLHLCGSVNGHCCVNISDSASSVLWTQLWPSSGLAPLGCRHNSSLTSVLLPNLIPRVMANAFDPQ